MDRRTAEVQGELVDKVSGSMYNMMKKDSGDNIDRYTGDEFEVIVAEQYDLWTNSELQTTVIIEQEDTDRVSVTMIAGGGGGGLLRWDWGSESNRTDDLVSTLRRVCDQWGLSFKSA